MFHAAPPYEIDLGTLSIQTDPRWFSTSSTEGEGAPLVELRRWPGDTALALYVLGGDALSDERGGPPLAGATLQSRPRAGDREAEWRGAIESERGALPVVWIERRIEGAATRLGALLIPGDAGLGEAAGEELLVELRAVLARVQIRVPAWRLRDGIPTGTKLLPPGMGMPPGKRNENEDPWQVATGSGFTLGLPPGIRSRRLDGAIPPPVPLPGGAMWLRGRYADLEGQEVVIGDGDHFGYVAEVAVADKGWIEGRTPPLGAPEARAVKRQPFSLAAERTGSAAASVERWRDAGFDGDWLVFRLQRGESGVEIGLPVVRGPRSESLYWIPVTWRPLGSRPAPPPVDPAERFGIRFDRLTPTERKDNPWVEGALIVPGLIADIPRGWSPAASLRSRDGYPVRIVDGDGETIGALDRLDASEIPSVEDPQLGWSAIPREAEPTPAGSTVPRRGAISSWRRKATRSCSYPSRSGRASRRCGAGWRARRGSFAPGGDRELPRAEKCPGNLAISRA